MISIIGMLRVSLKKEFSHVFQHFLLMEMELKVRLVLGRY